MEPAKAEPWEHLLGSKGNWRDAMFWAGFEN